MTFAILHFSFSSIPTYNKNNVILIVYILLLTVTWCSFNDSEYNRQHSFGWQLHEEIWIFLQHTLNAGNYHGRQTLH